MHTYRTYQFWSIDSCQNRVSTDQYHLTGLRCRPIEVKYFFWICSSFQMIAGSSLILFKFIWNMSCISAAQLKLWFKTDLGKFSQLLQAGKTVAFVFAHHDHALVPLFVQFLCCDWSKFDRWVRAENLCSILNLVYFDSWSWQSFATTCDVFKYFFPLGVQLRNGRRAACNHGVMDARGRC